MTNRHGYAHTQWLLLSTSQISRWLKEVIPAEALYSVQRTVRTSVTQLVVLQVGNLQIVIPRNSSASEIIKPSNRCILMGQKNCSSTWHLLGTHRTCSNLCESQRHPTRENASSFGTCWFRHPSQGPEWIHGY